jgi:hypothetical protein
MTKKKLFVLVLVFAAAAMVTADTNRQIFNSWVGCHYTQLGGNIAGRVSYNGNSITYDSSWTEVKREWVGPTGVTSANGRRVGGRMEAETRTYEIRHERWVTFYFDQNGIITTWRSYGWKMD